MALKLGIQTLRSYFKIIYEYDFHILPNRKVGAAKDHGQISSRPPSSGQPSIFKKFHKKKPLSSMVKSCFVAEKLNVKSVLFQMYTLSFNFLVSAALQ